MQYSRNIIASGHARAMVINSGGANACTGEAGYASSRAKQLTMQLLYWDAHLTMLIASTGLIGELLPLDAVFHGVEKAVNALDSSGGSWCICS